MRVDLPPLYPIVDAAVCGGRGIEPLGLLAACLRGGATLVQLRFKAGGSGAFLDAALRARALTDAAGARLIVNDRSDIAAMAGAAGVHVGQEDLPVEDVRRMLGPTAIVGYSTHSPDQIDAAAREPVSYVAVGPIFDTTTKNTGHTARGLVLVRHAAATGLPIVAIGGITLDNAPDVLNAGASAVAVIADLFEGDPETRVRAYLTRLAR